MSDRDEAQPSGETHDGRRPIHAPGAPLALGPYSHAVRAGGLLFCSGQTAIDPESGELMGADAGEQARRCLQNLSAVCDAADASLADAVRCTVWLTDMSTFTQVNGVYGEFFTSAPPARVTIEVSKLPGGAQVEIDAIVAVR